MEALILDTNFKAVDIIDTFDTFIWTDRYSECGDFELYPPLDTNNLDSLRDDYYLINRESEHVMIIENIQIDSDSEEGPALAISGRSLESILDRRIIWTQTVLSGNLQDAIKKILDENVISPTDTERQISNFVFESSTDEAITSLELSDEIQFTGDNVYDVVKVLCEVYSIGFKITLSNDNKFVFKLYAGIDRSYDQNVNPYVVFSPKFDNLLSSRYLSSKQNLKTITLVAGEGEGSERKTVSVSVEGDVTYSGLSRRELYTDARDVSQTVDGGTLSDDEYTSQLKERGTTKLTEHVEIKTFEGKCDTTMMYKVGTDYLVGDIVQLEDEYGRTSKSRITEIVYSENSSGFEMYPTFTTIQ